MSFRSEKSQNQKKITKIEFFQCDDNNSKLISLVGERPPLYNYKLPVKERSKNYKNELWHEVSDSLGVSVDECRARWKNLRDTYQLYRHKNKNSFAKWKFTEDLSFIENLHTYRTRKRNIKLQQKVLVSVPEISESPLHEISIQNAHGEIVEEEVVHEEDDERESYILEEIHNSDLSDSLISNTVHIKEYNSFDEFKNTEILECDTDKFIENVEINCKKTPTREKSKSRTPKRKFNCIEKEPNESFASNDLSHMDELDVFMEFLKKKIRKFSPNDTSDIQMKFIEIIFQKERNNQNLKYK